MLCAANIKLESFTFFDFVKVPFCHIDSSNYFGHKCFHDDVKIYSIYSHKKYIEIKLKNQRRKVKK